MLIAAGIVAVVSQLFQANDHTSVWLAFALAWLACALVAIASSSLVFRVAEVRKRITTQQHLRRTRGR
jgi:ABC-type branched-subunit amino acid transport system permease subunit